MNRIQSVFPCGLDPRSKHHQTHAHHNVDYPRWENEASDYATGWSYPFEPYYVARTACIPRFDEKFNFYGDDKVQQSMHMAAMRYWWVVLAQHFVVHVPHEPGKWAEWTADNQGERARNFQKVDKAMNEFRQALRQKPEAPLCERSTPGSFDVQGQAPDGLITQDWMARTGTKLAPVPVVTRTPTITPNLTSTPTTTTTPAAAIPSTTTPSTTTPSTTTPSTTTLSTRTTITAIEVKSAPPPPAAFLLVTLLLALLFIATKALLSRTRDPLQGPAKAL
jgi:hypothetical protein